MPKYKDATSVQFAFLELNPGLGAMGFAAEDAGGTRLGALMIDPAARDFYRTFNGSGSLVPTDDKADLVVANLPFSMFMDTEHADPAVMDIVRLARTSLRRNGSAIFRVRWDIGLRLDASPEEYCVAIGKIFPKMFVTHLVGSSFPISAVEAHELFIFLSPKGAVDIDGPIATGAPISMHPMRTAGHRFESAAITSLLSTFGFPANFAEHVGDDENARRFLWESVAVPYAKIVIQSFMTAQGK